MQMPGFKRLWRLRQAALWISSAGDVSSSSNNRISQRHFTSATLQQPDLRPAFSSAQLWRVRHESAEARNLNVLLRDAVTDGAVTQSIFSPFKAIRLRRQKGHLWRTRKSLSREAQLAVGELVRHKHDEERLKLVFSKTISRLLKIDLLSVLKELQRQEEGVLSLRLFLYARQEPWYKPDVIIYQAMLSCLAKCMMNDEAEKLFEETMLEEDKLEPNLNIYTEYLRALIFARKVDKVHKVVQQMKDEGYTPDIAVYKLLWIGLQAIERTKDATRYYQDLRDMSEASRLRGMATVSEIDI